jgi:exopolysaccharide biosynthesis polyprenyl glycosylphosphotransferase
VIKDCLLILGKGELSEKLHRELTRCGVDSRMIGLADEELCNVPDSQVSGIVIAEPDGHENRRLTAALLNCKLRGVPVESAIASFERLRHKVWLEALGPEAVIYSDGFGRSRWYGIFKRFFDLLLALLLLTASAPFLLILAIAIWMDSPGPVLFRQTRIGLFGEPFVLLKLRSMKDEAESETGPVWARIGDERVTRIGRLLRRFRLDEIPQAINVLRGEMSFIGPRPERPLFVKMLSDNIPYYDVRHYVKPGITGWAQVMYPYGASLKDAYEKLQYDLYYAKHMSPLLDLRIFFKSIGVVLFGRGR